MKIDDLMKLINAGFTKDDITALVNTGSTPEQETQPDAIPEQAAPVQEAPEEAKPAEETQPAQDDRISKLETKLDYLVNRFNYMQVQNSSQPDVKTETVDDILRSIVK